MKQRRRKRQQERQKGNRFWLAKQQLCTCITPFLCISLPSLRDYNVNFLISGFMEDENIRQRFSFFFLWTWIQSFRIQLLKKIASIWQMKSVRIWAMKSLLLTLPNICRLLRSSRKFFIQYLTYFYCRPFHGILLKRHEGERNNCFSKIQPVSQKYRE